MRIDPTVSSGKSCAPSWGFVHLDVLIVQDLHPDPKVQHYCLWVFFRFFVFLD